MLMFMENELRARAMTPPDNTPTAPPAAPVPTPMRKEFSLTSAAKYLGIGTATLRAKLNAGEIPFEKTATGQYVIQGAAIFQYEINQEADEKKDEVTRVVARASRGADTPASTRVDMGVTTRADTPAGTVPLEVHNAVKNGLESEIRVQKDTIRRLENDVDTWSEHAKKLQEQAASATRLLEHQKKEEESEKNISDGVGEGGDASWKWWLTSAAMATVIFGVVYVWQDEIEAAWQSVTSTSEIEPVAQSEPPAMQP